MRDSDAALRRGSAVLAQRLRVDAGGLIGAPSPTDPPAPSADGVGLGEGPTVGQVSVGTQANRTSYAMAGFNSTVPGSCEGSGSPGAASPAACWTTPIFSGSAAPMAVKPTVPLLLTVQSVPDTLAILKLP